MDMSLATCPLAVAALLLFLRRRRERVGERDRVADAEGREQRVDVAAGGLLGGVGGRGGGRRRGGLEGGDELALGLGLHGGERRLHRLAGRGRLLGLLEVAAGV